MIFLTLIPNVLFMAINTSLLSAAIDVCQDINYDLTNEIGPMMGLGYGLYRSCPSKVNN